MFMLASVDSNRWDIGEGAGGTWEKKQDKVCPQQNYRLGREPYRKIIIKGTQKSHCMGVGAAVVGA